MTTETTKVVDPRIAETAAKQKVVAAAIKKLVTINERAAAADAAAATASKQMVAVLNGETSEGEQDVSLLLKERTKQQKLSAKIRSVFAWSGSVTSSPVLGATPLPCTSKVANHGAMAGLFLYGVSTSMPSCQKRATIGETG